MSYFSGNGKYEKAYTFLFKKLVPPQGKALNELGEALRLVNKVYYRRNNDGDSYDDCIEYGIVQDLSKKVYPFDKEYHELGVELDHLLTQRRYDDAMNLVLVHIMLSLSSTTSIYNPNTNRLVPIDSVAGKNALKLLDLNSIFINYCGKNEEWLPESLREAGVKITKMLSEETRKELKCDTIQEYHIDYKSRPNKKSVKVVLSQDNAILSKKFSKINRQHKRSVKENNKKRKELTKKRELRDKKKVRQNVKEFNSTKMLYQQVKELSVSKRVEGIKKMTYNKNVRNSLVQMFLVTLLEYKEKKITSQSQRENKKRVLEKLVKGLNEAGTYILKRLDSYNSTNSLYSYYLDLPDELDSKLEGILIDILGSPEAIQSLYLRCCR